MEIYLSTMNVFLAKHSIPPAPFFKGERYLPLVQHGSELHDTCISHESRRSK